MAAIAKTGQFFVLTNCIVQAGVEAVSIVKAALGYVGVGARTILAGVCRAEQVEFSSKRHKAHLQPDYRALEATGLVAVLDSCQNGNSCVCARCSRGGLAHRRRAG